MAGKTLEEPLIHGKETGGSGGEAWRAYQHVGRTGSLLPTAALSGTGFTVHEIRSADPSNCYPTLIDDADRRENTTSYPYPIGGVFGGNPNDFRRQVLDEVEMRELLIDHVGHRCCWGSRPARYWKIHAVEDCNVYAGTLETFIEERVAIVEAEPYAGGKIDGKDGGAELGIWDLDLRSEFPFLFILQKEVRVKVPHSEFIEKCTECVGRGDLVCPECNADQETGLYKENQMTQCAVCYGRGLIAHQDGSDTVCVKCEGKGRIPCSTCTSRGLVKCSRCRGNGSLLFRQFALVRWKTLATRKISATSGVASVPDAVFHNAQGVQLCNTQAYQCAPAFFADSYFLNKFSSEVIADRPAIPPAARVICERHVISVVPVTRVTMAHRSKSFSFYVVGLSRDVYLKDYYPATFCWGLCPCLDWLKL